MPRTSERFVLEGDRVLMRSFAASHPGVYLRWFNVSGHSETGPTFMPRRSRTYNEDLAITIERDDRESSDPALFFECSPIPNLYFSAVTEIVTDNSEPNERGSYKLQIYTVRSGTHQGKRLVKVQDPETSRYKAAGFLNRDASFTPWNNSMWAEDHTLHLVIRNFLNRYRSNPDLMSSDRPIPGAETIWVRYIFGEGDFRCLQCNSQTEETSRICEYHLPFRTLGVDGVSTYEVESEQTRRNRLSFEAGAERDRQHRRRRELTRQERQRQLAIEQEQAQQRQREEVLASFVPLLSENRTGLIR